MKVLVVDDDVDLLDLMTYALRREGYNVLAAVDGQQALQRWESENPDIVLLDGNLPKIDGFEVCRRIRHESKTPIIMLTARDEEEDILRGLQIGADDYMTKPFSPGELVARVGALLRRARAGAPAGATASAVLEYGPIRLDIQRHLVTVNGDGVKLTAKEFLLLRYLMEHRGRLVSRDVLLRDVWGYQFTGGTRTVDVHVRRLREKIGLLARAITTIKQFGYRLEDPAERA